MLKELEFQILQMLLQSHNNKENMVLTQNQTCKPKVKNKGPKVSTYIFSHLICQKHKLEKRKHFQQMMMRKLDVHMQKKIGPVSTYHLGQKLTLNGSKI